MCICIYIYIYMATTPRTYLRSHPIAMPTHQKHFQCQLKSRNKTNKKHKNFGNNKNTLENIAKNLWNEQKHNLEHQQCLKERAFTHQKEHVEFALPLLKVTACFEHM